MSLQLGKMKRNLGNDVGARALKSCEDCAATHYSGFRKVAARHGTSFAVYLHMQNVRSGSDPERREKSSQNRESSRQPETLIVHNTSDTDITGITMVRELNKYKTNCVSCKGIVKRVRTLLKEIRVIRKDEVYATCDHCKRTGLKCKRCEYILDKFKERNSEERELLFKQWLCKVKQLLQTISKGNICQYRLLQETSDAAELDNLLMELSSPTLAQRQLEIGAFPPVEFQEDLAQSKDMLQELITKLKYDSGTKQYSSDDSLFTPASIACVCKYLMDRKTEQRKALQTMNQQETEPPKLVEVPSEIKVVSKPEAKESLVTEHKLKGREKSKKGSSTTVGSTKVGSVKEKSTKATKGSSTTVKSVTDKSNKARKGSSTVRSSGTNKENKPDTKPNKAAHSEQSELFKKLMSERAKEKKAAKPPKQPVIKLPSFGELPKVVRHIKRKEVVETISESIIECHEGIMGPKEIVAGKKIIPFHEHDIHKSDSIQPLLFQVVEAESEELQPKSNIQLGAKCRMKKNDISEMSGVIKYMLSDRQFIENGWTLLPSTKILRRMNIYKMIPARRDDWFTHHRNRGTMFYPSGERLAAIENDGQGKWFYKNGKVALEFYNAEEKFVEKRCVVYSYKACIDLKTTKCQTVLACFDTLGNGVIYDCQGNERLKYNQTEGQLIDKKIGPPSFWKWHTLNDPPVLQKTFTDTYYKDSTTFEEPRPEDNQDDDDEKPQRKEADEAMLVIEFNNFVKEKADKLLQKFKPFQIRMKTVKINDHFSVRVIDQADVCLLFRDGPLALKLDLGMLLQSNEIIDTDSVEVSCVGTPYDRRPARSKSVDRLQGILSAARGKQNGCEHCDSTTSSMRSKIYL